jgi:hypothetical protein
MKKSIFLWLKVGNFVVFVKCLWYDGGMNDENKLMPDVIDFAENKVPSVAGAEGKPEVAMIELPDAPSADTPVVTLAGRKNLSVEDTISPNAAANQMASLGKDDLVAELQGIIDDLEVKTARMEQIVKALSNL